jgi:hypothetical protein
MDHELQHRKRTSLTTSAVDENEKEIRWICTVTALYCIALALAATMLPAFEKEPKHLFFLSFFLHGNSSFSLSLTSIFRPIHFWIVRCAQTHYDRERSIRRYQKHGMTGLLYLKLTSSQGHDHTYGGIHLWTMSLKQRTQTFSKV